GRRAGRGGVHQRQGVDRQARAGAVADDGEVAAQAAGVAGEGGVHLAVGLGQFAEGDVAADRAGGAAAGGDGAVQIDGAGGLGQGGAGDGGGGGDGQGGESELVHVDLLGKAVCFG